MIYNNLGMYIHVWSQSDVIVIGKKLVIDISNSLLKLFLFMTTETPWEPRK